MSSLVFYVSGHGFGHASRDIELINALLARRPDLGIAVRTSAPRWLFDRTVRATVHYEHMECDTGLVQIDSLHLDAAESVRRARAFMQDMPALAAREADRLRDDRTALVVSDMPPLGILAAKQAGVPAIALGNFSWDWAYSAYEDAGDVVAAIAAIYREADLALRLPFQGGFDAFRRVVDLPFIARHATHAPGETRAALGLPADERLVLVSFGGYGVGGVDLAALERIEGYTLLVSSSAPLGSRAQPMAGRIRQGSILPFDEDAMYARGFRYEDLVGAVDVVATKPGYGTVAECIANGTDLLYTSRGHFNEYDVMVREMPRYLRAAYIPHDDLFAGRWAPYLESLASQPRPPESPATNGADLAAEMILSMMSP